MKKIFLVIAIFSLAVFTWSCQEKDALISKNSNDDFTAYHDSAFWQEYHEAYPLGKGNEANVVRSITIDREGSVWIATPAGVFKKRRDSRDWVDAIPAKDQGPSFSIVTDRDSAIWISTWNNVYRFKDNQLEVIQGPQSPISVLCASAEGVYALGPKGIWFLSNERSLKLEYPVARSVRDAVVDPEGTVWIGTDVGLYRCTNDSTYHFYKTSDLVSAYVRGIDMDGDGKVWLAGLGGVTIRDEQSVKETLLPQNGIPSIQVNCVKRSQDGVMWVGTNVGVVRYDKMRKHSLRFSRRWLLDDQVNDIAFDKNGNAWIATSNGVSAIKRKQMTLASKQKYFYEVLIRRHIRDPWIAGQCRLLIGGDTTRWEPEDDDNDGEYTGNYLAMESFRYAATGSADAKEKARKAFSFLKLLQDVAGTDGFFARTIVPSDWKSVHDGNRTFSEKELADELVREPRFKPVEIRWRKSKDGKWMWKGDTSSDEICGHMFGYFFYYELVADENEKKIIREHVSNIVDHLIRNNYTLTDIDGTHTRWGVWSPDRLNHDPEWQPDRSLNSMELLSFLKFAYHVTQDEKYQKEYLRLINEEGYLNNMADIPKQNPGWFIYFDVILAAYQYPILLKCETDTTLLRFYEKHIDEWIERRKDDKNPLINFIYCYSRNKNVELSSSIDFLIDTPLDLIDWQIDHAKREDIKLVHSPVLDDLQMSELPPASVRATVRWDKNPWGLNNGNPQLEREPVFWLLPYWMGRYMKMIE
ncbi:MAG TPA: two-component regulator propeller domain-containing protein [Cyclobacteriaceae bacterium]|nr:two-component regulator propeller domain-containing protein [Cyclobacteriaceae bacterium]